MCSYITEKTDIFGSAKGRSGWMHVDTAVVYYDHPTHVPLDHALNIDFVNSRTHERVAIELSGDSARELIARIKAALDSGDAIHLGSHDPEPMLVNGAPA
jgi:Family of unknown function (DUF6295)